MTVEQALLDYLDEQSFRGNTERTVLYYRRSIGSFMRYVGNSFEMENITLQTIRGYSAAVRERKVSSITLQTYMRALRSFLTYCYEQGYLPEDLSARFKPPKAKRKEIDVLTDNEVRILFSSFNVKSFLQMRNFCICALMLDSGLRLNEVVTLTLPHLKLREGFAIVDGKGNKQRVVPLGLTSRRMLSRYIARRPAIAQTERLFLQSNLEPITMTTVRQLFKRLKQRTCIERLHPHLLRHTFATRYLENGGDMYSLEQILGHTSLEMVKRYVHSTHRKTVENFPVFSPLDGIARK